jgi:hypothetical protein
MEVLRRTNYGKAWMNPNEMERHIMNGARATKLRIEEVVAATKSKTVELVGGVFGMSGGGPSDFYPLRPDGTLAVGLVDPMAFEIRIPIGNRAPTIQVPYEAVRAAWVAPNSSIMVMLDARVVWDGTSLTLLPYGA